MRLCALIAVAAGLAPPPLARADGLPELVAACRDALGEETRGAAYARTMSVRLDDAALGAITVEPAAGRQRLAIDFARDLKAERSRITVDGGAALATATLESSRAGALVKARERGELSGRLVFRFREPDRGGETASVIDQACVLGAPALRVRAAPLWVDLAAPGLAVRLLTPQGAAEPVPGAAREVKVIGEGADASGLVRAAAPLRERALACFAGRPSGGRLALELELGAGGEVQLAHAMVDGVRDDQLRECVISAARGLALGKGRGRRVELTLEFLIGRAP